MENEPEKMTDRTAAPGSQNSTAAPGSQSSSAAQSSPVAPKQVVVNNGFDKLFFALSIPFIVISLLVVAVSVFFAVFGIPETRWDYVPDFVKYLTGNQYELIVHKPGPIDDNLFRSTTAHLLVRTDADVVSLIKHMDAPDFKFIPFDSPELETDKRWNQVYDSKAEIDKVYRELAGTPPGADCRYFVTRDDPDYVTTYLCFSPESKLLLFVRVWRR